MNRRDFLWLGLAIAGAAILVTALPATERRAVGVVLITLDTTRADRLSPYGLMDVSMPHLERLAREGVVFDQATSVAPLTLPAHSSIFTGLFPAAHGVRDNADQPLSAERTTLAEVLKAEGLETAAFVGSAVLDPERGLDQGFNKYSGVSQTTLKGRTTTQPSVESRQRRGDEVMSDAVQWLDGIGDTRFFLWTHLYDPHRPYDPPEPFRSRHFDPYVGEIAFVDSQIGRLLEALENRGVLERTLVVVAGDHGESLGEHGERDHGIFLYESVLRVPLIVRGPGFAPRRVGDVVRLVDVMPTILDALDLPAPSMDGVSLVDVMHATRSVDLEVVAESLYPLRFGWSPLRALRGGRFKLVDAPRPELYDLERDPFETRNLFDDRRALADAMTRRLDALTGGRHTLRDLNRGVVPARLRDDLAALGYVTGSPMQTLANQNNLPDPKDRIGTMDANLRSGDRVIGATSIFDRAKSDRAIHVRSDMDRTISGSQIADRR